MEVLEKLKNKHLSPLLGIVVTAVTTASILSPARGETDSPLALEPLNSPLQPVVAIPPESQITEKFPLQGADFTIAAESGGGGATATEGEKLPAFSQQPPRTPEPPKAAEEATPPAGGQSTGDTPGSSPTPPASPIPAPVTEDSGTTESPPASAEEPRVLVGEVAVTGATPELETLVYNTIRTRPGRTATRSQLQEDVNAIYATGYFANVKVTPEDTPLGVRVAFAVQPNPIFQKLTIETVPATDKKNILPPEVIQETFGQQYGKILNLRELQEGIKKISQWYTDKGFDLAQIVGAPKISGDGTVTLVIAEGVVEKIQVRFFSGEDEPVQGRTRDFIVTREMQLKPGDVFNRFISQLDLQRIYSLGLFEDVRLSFTPGADPEEVIVNVDVVEGNTGSISAGGGFSSAAGLFATISYQQQNLGGNNQKVAGQFQVGERELLFDLSFTDPWIAGDPFRTSYTANIFRSRSISLVYDGNDTSIQTAAGITLTPDGYTTFPGSSPRVVRTGAGISFSRPIAESVFSRADWVLSLGTTYQSVRIENSDGDLRPISAALVNQFGQFWPSQQLAYNQGGVDDFLTVNFIASQDFRNNPLRPTSGHVLRLGVEQSLPLTGINFNRLRGSYSYYIPVNWIDLSSFLSIFGVEEDKDKPKPQAIAFNIQAGTVMGNLPPYEAFVLGGSNSVRGYAEGEVGNGRSFVQATAEYRFPIISEVGVALFFDYGSVLGSDGAVIGVPSLVRGLPGWGYGYGIGVRVQSPVGAIRVDYGINNNGDSRVSFGIGERF